MVNESLDEAFLRLNDELKLVPSERIIAAMKKLSEETTVGSRPRALVEVLRAQGALTGEVERRLREHPQGRALLAEDPASGLWRGSDESLLDMGAPPTKATAAPSEVSPPQISLPPAPPRKDGGWERAPDSMLDMNAPPPRTEITPVTIDFSEGSPPTPATQEGAARTPSRAVRRRPAEVELADAQPRNRLGPFVLVHELGRGGMGTVYRAWHNPVGRFVALKVLHTREPEAMERFVREAQISARLQHPRVATVFEAGEIDAKSYIAMQFIDGPPINRGNRPVKQIIELIRDAAGALHYAHEQGIVHRDVKPGNLLVDKDGSVFLTDFGVAKEVSGEFSSSFSITGTVLGTPEYMSPEQARGDPKLITARSDVYSLGATLFALLAGRPPFTGKNIGDLLINVISKSPPPLSKFNRAVSPELEGVVAKSMAKDPARRFETAEAFAQELDRLVQQGRYVGKYGLAKMLAKRWLPRAVAGALLGLALRYGVPLLVPKGEPVNATGPGRVAITLDDIKRQLTESAGSASSVELGNHLEFLNKVLEGDADNLDAQVTRARVYYVLHRIPDVEREMKALEPHHRRDYRIPFLRAQLALEKFLDVPPPLPDPLAPVQAWLCAPAVLPPAIANDLRAVQKGDLDGGLVSERQRDAEAAKALLHMADAHWSQAATDLQPLKKTLPLYDRAWIRAAYLARNFDEVWTSSKSSGTRERTGAGIARAIRSAEAVKELEQLLSAEKPDLPAASLIRTVLVRLLVDAGRSPEPHLQNEPAIAAEPWVNEMNAAMQAARLRWRALSGKDDEPAYRQALDQVGKNPATWSGRVAAAELLLAWGARRARRHDAEAPATLEQALVLAQGLARDAEGWKIPRLLQAMIDLRRERLDDAGGALFDLLQSAEPGVRALLAGSAVELARADVRRRSGLDFKENLDKAREYVRRVRSQAPTHPEALNLSGAVAVLEAETLVAQGEDEAAMLEEALTRLNESLAQIPGYVDAQVHRAEALFLRGEWKRRAQPDGVEDHQAALADLNAALESVPELSAARYARGVVHFALRDYAAAAEDWKTLLEDEAWKRPEIEAWIKQAESMK